MIIIIFYNGNNLGIHLIIDYGLPSFYQISRRSSFASLSDTSIDDHRRRQSAIQVYLPPEVRGMLDTEQPSPTTDVYRQASIHDQWYTVAVLCIHVYIEYF